ncbi:hypothetical protein [Dictyobacter kobayashii]|uniref:hypothetical protein n=1 Tax=Dictyobacter kobayashii TaxID=2014872 RepID=UPI001386CDB4|nr:hypothetical protein [Dictyobacter kobayashii]
MLCEQNPGIFFTDNWKRRSSAASRDIHRPRWYSYRLHRLDDAVSTRKKMLQK